MPVPAVVDALATYSLEGQNKTTVVVGATQGVGAAIARKMAGLGCSRIINTGRNTVLGNELIEKMKGLAPGALQAEFVVVDCSCVSLVSNHLRVSTEGTCTEICDTSYWRFRTNEKSKQGALAIEKALEGDKIDYLVNSVTAATQAELTSLIMV
jgi:NAD(P)-dependent dehydrogenase (short-subunit alcohol dehydrogenase family)